MEADLREPGVTRQAMQGIEVVFHLAADHGGRGYVDLHQAGPASNLFLDGLVFWEAVKAGVAKVVYASSGCVYPNYMQTDAKKELYLREEDVKPPHDADNMYGWAKLMAEMTLQAYHREFNLDAASCRYFTVYGPRGVENHAVIAMIARAFVHQDPFEVWGDGCLPAEASIISNSGIQSISQVPEGGEVLGLDGKYHRVLVRSTHPYQGTMVSFKPMGMKKLSFTADHPILVTRLKTTCNLLGPKRPHKCKPCCWCLDPKHRYHHQPHPTEVSTDWVPASEIRTGDFVMIPVVKKQEPQTIYLDGHIRAKCSKLYLPRNIEIDADVAYLLGWFTAEGWTNWNQNRHNAAKKATVAMALALKERSYVLELAEIVRRLGFRPHVRKRKSSYELSFSATHLARWLDNHVGKGARAKQVPSCIFQAPNDICERFLDGLFRGDGWQGRYTKRLTSTSGILLEGVQVILAKLSLYGYHNHFTSKDGSVDQGVVGFTQNKRRRYWVDDNFVYVPVNRVEQEHFEGYVYNLETEDHTFCAPIAVHNSQIRNWTYVDDIVSGTILAGEKIDDGTAVNLGTMERIRVLDAAKMITEHAASLPGGEGYHPQFRFLKNMPTGPVNRVADNHLAKTLLGWEPKTLFRQGLRKTMDWYFKSKQRQQVRDVLETMLTAR
jgi:nucleoside-diphosphate-sugar epimerase